MLDELHIKDVALIEEATFAPGEGLTVVTGETGAGKTALLSALKLLVGERADVGMIREGHPSLSVEGRFFLDGSPEEGDVVVRTFSDAGRSRISLNGSPCSAKVVASRVGESIDLCGQHEHQRLTKPASQLDLLDAWAGERVAVPLEAYRGCLAEARQAQAELERLEALGESDQRELGQARFLVEKVDEVAPEPGEYERLLEEMPRFEHAESLLRETSLAREALTADNGALVALEQAMGAVERVAAIDGSFEPAAQLVRDAFYSAEEVSALLASYAGGIEFDPQEAERRQERIAACQGLMRGYGPTMDEVFASYEAALRRIDEDRNRDALIEKAAAARDVAEEALAGAAQELACARQAAAPLFAAEVTAQMERLCMGSAFVEVSFEDLPRAQWGSTGSQALQLLFAPGAKLTPQPLSKIASGGELSRVMLATKVVIGSLDDADTLVFDEIDAGTGGATAVALAEVLADLARTHQVIVVTHLPQVAVKGGTHYVVRKSAHEHPVTSLELVEGDARVREIARMLSGDEGETSLVHARELLAR